MAYHAHSHKTGKDLLFAALRHEEVEEVPWVPFDCVAKVPMVMAGADSLASI